MLGVARYLSPANFGILSFAIALTTIISVVGDLGLQWYTTRDLSRDIKRAPQYLANLIPMKIILAVLSYGIIIVIVFLTGLPKQTALTVSFIGIAVVMNIFMLLFQGFYQASERMEFVGFGQLLNAVLIFTGVFVAIFLKLDVVAFALIYLFSGIITMVFHIIVMLAAFPGTLPGSISSGLKIEQAFIKGAFAACWPIAVAAIFNALYSWIDTVILSFLCDIAVAGYYNASYKMIMTLYIIPVSLAAAVFPVMARYFVRDRNMSELALEKSLKYLFILSLPIATATTILSERFIIQFYGEAFLPAALSLKILVWSVPFYFTNVVFGNYFNVANRQIVYTLACVIMAVVNVAVNLIFVPMIGLAAAGIAKLTADVSFTAVLLFQVRSIGYSIKYRTMLISFGKIILASAVMLGFLIFLYNMNMIILVGLAALLYFGVLLILRPFDDNDWNIARQLVNNGSAGKVPD